MTNQELISWIKKRPLVVICAVMALAFAVTIYFRSDGLPVAQALLAQKSSEGERLALNLRNSAQLSEQLDSVSGSMKVVESRLIHPADLAQNLQFFYKLEGSTGVKLSDLRQIPLSSPKAGAPPVNFVGVSYSVSLEGDYLSLVEFLGGLEHGAAHICRINSASITTTTTERGGPLRLTLFLELLGRP